MGPTGTTFLGIGTLFLPLCDLSLDSRTLLWGHRYKWSLSLSLSLKDSLPLSPTIFFFGFGFWVDCQGKSRYLCSHFVYTIWVWFWGIEWKTLKSDRFLVFQILFFRINFWVPSGYHVSISVGFFNRPNIFWTIQIYSLSLPHPTTLSSFSISKIRIIQNTFGRLE